VKKKKKKKKKKKRKRKKMREMREFLMKKKNCKIITRRSHQIKSNLKV